MKLHTMQSLRAPEKPKRIPEKPKLIRSTNAYIYDKYTTNTYGVEIEETIQPLIPHPPKLIRSTNAYNLNFEELLQKWVLQQESATEPKEINENIKS